LIVISAELRKLLTYVLAALLITGWKAVDIAHPLLHRHGHSASTVDHAPDQAPAKCCGHCRPSNSDDEKSKPKKSGLGWSAAGSDCSLNCSLCEIIKSTHWWQPNRTNFQVAWARFEKSNLPFVSQSKIVFATLARGPPSLI
jgi:hypothetical protein